MFLLSAYVEGIHKWMVKVHSSWIQKDEILFFGTEQHSNYKNARVMLPSKNTAV